MTRPNDFDKQITAHLFGTPIRDADPGLALIASRSRLRTHRRRAGTAVLTIAALVGTGTFIADRLRPRAERVTTAAETGTEASESVSSLSTVAAMSEAPRPVANFPKSALKWQRVDSSASLAAPTILRDGDTFLAISTIPGQVSPQNSPEDKLYLRNVLYTSADGISWKRWSSLPTDLSWNDVALADGTLYAIGTAAATGPIADSMSGVDLVVATQSDGKTWKNHVLPFDLRGIRKAGVEINTGSSTLAHFGKTFVAAATFHLAFDVAKHLPQGVSAPYGASLSGPNALVYGKPSAAVAQCEASMNSVGGAPGGVFTTVPIPGLPTTLAPLSGNMSQPRSMGDANVSGDCIDILRQPRPVTATFKIADLGLEPALSAALAQPLHLFVSGDGQKFEAVSVPADLVNNPNQNPFSAGAQVLADRHGFVLLNKTSDSAGEHIALYRSGDGRAWTKIGAVEGSVISVGTVGGRTSMWLWNTAEQTGSRAVRLSDDGNTIEDNVGNTRDNAAFQIGTDWSIHPGSDSVSIGDAGYTVVLSQDPGTAGTSPFHLGGFTFTISWINDGNILKVTDDATGEVVADGALPFENRGPSPTDPRIRVSGEQLTIVGADGKVRVTLPLAQIFQERVYAADNNVMKSAQLLDSPDGITWTSTKVADLIDLDAVPVIRISNVYVDRDRIILTLLVARHDSGPADTITFVGRRG